MSPAPVRGVVINARSARSRLAIVNRLTPIGSRECIDRGYQPDPPGEVAPPPVRPGRDARGHGAVKAQLDPDQTALFDKRVVATSVHWAR